MRKKLCLFGFTLGFFFAFGGCFLPDYTKTPVTYGKGLWVSDDPDAWFRVEDEDNYIHGFYLEGAITVKENTTEWVLTTDRAGRYAFCKINEPNDDPTYAFDRAYFYGDYKVTPEKMVVKNIKADDNFTLTEDEQDMVDYVLEYGKLVFTKVEAK